MNRMPYYISQDRVVTPTMIRGEVGNYVAILLQYLCAKNYQNTMLFDKVIAKIKGCNFLPHSVLLLVLDFGLDMSSPCPWP